MDLVMDEHILRRLNENHIPPISEYDPELLVTWFIPRKTTMRKTKNGKDYYIVEVIDSNSVQTSIKCWGVDPMRDRIYNNRPYMAKLSYDEQWGFSTRSIRHTFKLLA